MTAAPEPLDLAGMREKAERAVAAWAAALDAGTDMAGQGMWQAHFAAVRAHHAAWHPAAAIRLLDRLEAAKAAVEEGAPFVAVWTARHARDHGLPAGTLHPVHFAILARANAAGAGLRLDDWRPAPDPAP